MREERETIVTGYSFRLRVERLAPACSRVRISRKMVRRLTPKARAKSSSVGAAPCAAACRPRKAAPAQIPEPSHPSE